MVPPYGLNDPPPRADKEVSEHTTILLQEWSTTSTTQKTAGATDGFALVPS